MLKTITIVSLMTALVACSLAPSLPEPSGVDTAKSETKSQSEASDQDMSMTTLLARLLGQIGQ